MVFYLAGLQNIDYSVYEAAKIDGANGWKTFWKITVPLLKPTIIMTFIMSINGTLQLFDESVNLTKGGPANSTITMSHYIYNTCFINVPNVCLLYTSLLRKPQSGRVERDRGKRAGECHRGKINE